MLDNETKRRIDTARDILVGKVPDPKSQVEQITIAMIYKFMDDMDAEAEEMGGERTFFAGSFARYGWAKLMSPGIGGHELISLYGEGISSMPQNSKIPPLFRDIFKNAYLPYRDPETLKSFLKIINEFSYDHSERLGDAFEYLLSVLGSQGDAGQFRTPRHIIDFMVEIMAPKKGEAILDPACGTAGFLISAYKFIKKTNIDKKGQSTLGPDDNNKLAENFKGYDISPDMVRLSLVNLYLHGFTDPHVFEYDTLTSEDRWNEFADVILANPPFMSPKGGIKPHKRFSIQAKRSEVLFVDYMTEHLTPNGRAAIIVPEGIIFQSQTAYKDLRKMLVENSLVAVVSLPAGCFNPYSGVKTSILILDKSIAKQSDTIAFFKVENDGFGLGAQRRAFDKNDLPEVKEKLAAYLHAIRTKASTETILAHTSSTQIVLKEKIAANGDYNLSGERYRETEAKTQRFQLVKIEEVCLTSSGGTPLSSKSEYYEGGTIPWLRSGEVAQGEVFRSELFITEEGLMNSSAKIFPPNTVLVAMYGATAGEVGILRTEAATNQAVCGITPEERLCADFLYLILKCNKQALIRLAGGGAQPNISQKIIREFQIPLPPLDVQMEIVAEIEGYQKVINGARAVLDNYRPHIPIQPDWTLEAIGSICLIGDGNHSSNYPKASEMISHGVSFIRGTNLIDGRIDPNNMRFISHEKHLQLKKGHLKTNDVIFTNRGEIGKVAIVDERFDGANLNSQLAWLRAKDGLLPTYLLTVLQSTFIQDRLHVEKNGATLQQFTIKQINELKIPLPPLVAQQAIVSEIESEQALVAANRELIRRFEKKIQATLLRIWGE